MPDEETPDTEHDSSIQTFLAWEKASRDTIDVKRMYVDVTGDLVAGILLSQIVFWFLPQKDGTTKLTIERDDKLWLAKPREDWWDECRISPKQFDRACALLESLELIDTAVFKFNGFSTKHITINLGRLMERVKGLLPKGQKGFYPKGNSAFTQRSKAYKEAETTAETTAENKTLSGAKAPDPRFKPFVDDLKKYWDFKNPNLAFNFSPADGKELNRFLSNHRDMTSEQFRTCLNHRARSDLVHTQQIHRWIGRVQEFFDGPLDQFWKPKGNMNSNGTVINKADQRAVDIRESARRVYQRTVGQIDSASGRNPDKDS